MGGQPVLRPPVAQAVLGDSWQGGLMVSPELQSKVEFAHPWPLNLHR